MQVRATLTLVGLLLLPPAAPTLAAQSAPGAATVRVLDLLPGYTATVGRGVNASGQVAGNSVAYGAVFLQGAVLTGPGGQGVRALGTLPGDQSSDAYAVNVSGQVVGNSFGTGTQAFITGADGQGMRGLGFLPGGSFSAAWGINAAGQVTGLASTASGSRAFITGPGGQDMRDLGVLPGFRESWGVAINASGQVAGRLTNTFLQPGDVPDEAFLTGPNGVGMRALGFLPGGTASIASGVNASGQVVGVSLAVGRAQAFVTGADGRNMQGLGYGSVADPYDSQANGIDDAGRVVGLVRQRVGGSFVGFGFVYTPGVGLQLLDDVLGGGWRVESASAISPTDGYVVAYGSNASLGISSSALLIRLGTDVAVVPEPHTSVLVGTALVVVGGGVRRRRHRNVPA